MKIELYKLILFLITCGLASEALPQTPPNVLSSGHHPVEIRFLEGEFQAQIAGSHGTTDTYSPESIVMHLTPASELSIPASPRFAFLGDAGSPLWIAPHVENPGILQLGFGGSGIPQGTFQGNRLHARLETIDGPGDFFIYEIDSTGGVTVRLNTADGITQEDILAFSTDGHDHQNWAFNAEGHYTLTWIVEGTPADGSTISSMPIEIRYAVGDVNPLQSSGPVIIDKGDADIAAILVGDRIVLESFWGLTEMAYNPSETIYRIKANSRTVVPDDEAFAFLGQPGAVVWVGPQAEIDGKIYLAMAADNFPTGVVESDRIDVRLVSYEGPGQFALYETDAFALPAVNFNTADGVDEADLRILTATEHSHLNWAFSAPGTYTIHLQASATRSSDGLPLSSEITSFTFEVVPPVRPALKVTGPASVTLSWEGIANTSYVIQRTADIAEGNWENFSDPITGLYGIITRTIDISAESTEFLRVLEMAE